MGSVTTFPIFFQKLKLTYIPLQVEGQGLFWKKNCLLIFLKHIAEADCSMADLYAQADPCHGWCHNVLRTRFIGRFSCSGPLFLHSSYYFHGNLGRNSSWPNVPSTLKWSSSRKYSFETVLMVSSLVNQMAALLLMEPLNYKVSASVVKAALIRWLTKINSITGIRIRLACCPRKHSCINLKCT